MNSPANKRRSADRSLDLSVIIPVYNEEQNVGPLHERLKAVLESTGRTYEIIFVDDGSGDGTYDALVELCARDSNTRALRLRMNRGQTAGLSAVSAMAHLGGAAAGFGFWWLWRAPARVSTGAPPGLP